MNVLFDTGILLPLIQPDIQVPIPKGIDPSKFDAEGRVKYLIEVLRGQKATIIIPTPVLGELLVKESADGNDALLMLQSHPNIRIVPFDIRSAIECALLQRTNGVRLGLGDEYRRAAAKVDAQILSCGIVEQVDVVYCADGWMRNAAKKLGIDTISFDELPLPPQDDQQALDL